MKNRPISLMLAFFLLAGCGGKEEPATVTEKPSGETPAEVEELAPQTSSGDNLVASKDSVAELNEMARKVADGINEKSLNEAEKMTKEMQLQPVPQAADEEYSVGGSEVFQVASDTAKSMAASVDWSSLSWDQVSDIPYDNKEQLAAWALSKTESLRNRLAEETKTQGLQALSNLGNTGWQGALKKVMDAIEGLRKASPETWELAKSSLVGAWNQFETLAAEYLNKD